RLGADAGGLHTRKHGIDIVHPDADPVLRAPAPLFPVFRIAIKPDLRVADKELGIPDDALRVQPSPALGETEDTSEPIDHRGHIVVMQVWRYAFELRCGCVHILPSFNVIRCDCTLGSEWIYSMA